MQIYLFMHVKMKYSRAINWHNQQIKRAHLAYSLPLLVLSRLFR